MDPCSISSDGWRNMREKHQPAPSFAPEDQLIEWTESNSESGAQMISSGNLRNDGFKNRLHLSTLRIGRRRAGSQDPSLGENEISPKWLLDPITTSTRTAKTLLTSSTIFLDLQVQLIRTWWLMPKIPSNTRTMSCVNSQMDLMSYKTFFGSNLFRFIFNLTPNSS